MYPILIVEDDKEAIEGYTHSLSKDEYPLECVSNVKDAIDWLRSNTPRLVSLDIQLPEHEGTEKLNRDGGYTIFQEIIQLHPQVPVIFVTSLLDNISQISALRMGAWDYVTKPVDLQVYRERIKRLIGISDKLRNSLNEEDKKLIAIGDLTLDRERAIAKWKGSELLLTVAEFDILFILADKPNIVVSYKKLKRGGVVENQTINRHISNLKNKIKKFDGQFDCIENVFSRGYKFRCE